MTLSGSSENRSKPVNQVTPSAQKLWNEHQPDLFSLWKPTLALAPPADTEQAADAAPVSCCWELLLSELCSFWFQPGSEADINYTHVLAEGSRLLCIWSYLVFILSPLSPPFASSCPSCIAVLLLLLLISPRLCFFLMFFPSFYRFPSSSACVHFDLSKMLTFEDAECSEGQAESERRPR